MTIYCVFREGVYRHECAGAFQLLADAIKCAQLMKNGEPDDRHDYIVVPFETGETTPRNASARYGDLVEPRPVFSTLPNEWRMRPRSE